MRADDGGIDGNWYRQMDPSESEESEIESTIASERHLRATEKESQESV